MFILGTILQDKLFKELRQYEPQLQHITRKVEKAGNSKIVSKVVPSMVTYDTIFRTTVKR